MNITRLTKIVQYLTLLSIIIFLFWFSYAIWQSRDMAEKFNKTKLNVTYNELVKHWGEPHEEFDMNLSYDKRHIIKYTDMIGDNYIFASEEGKEIISEKFIDD